MDTITIDGRTVPLEKGDTVLAAAKRAGIYVPTLCTHPDLEPCGACRMCIVQIEGMRGYPTSCTTLAVPGMVVHSDAAEVQAMRRDILALILSEHPSACLVCERSEECREYHECTRKVGAITGCRFCPNDMQCELQDVVNRLGVRTLPFIPSYREIPVDRRDPFIDKDMNLCILCGRCVRVCGEIRGAGAIAFNFRGERSQVGTAYDRRLVDTTCQFCGACVDVCPTGALSERVNKWSGPPDGSVVTTCPFCAVGCQLRLFTKGGYVAGVEPERDPVVNRGQACVKGRFAAVEVVHSGRRVAYPLIRVGGVLRQVTWGQAIDAVAGGLEKARGDGFSMMLSPTLTNEDLYVSAKFARAVMGSNNVDTIGRPFTVPSVAGLATLFSESATIDDLREASHIIAVGRDTKFTHTVLGVEVKRAVDRGAELIVVGPERTILVPWATVWVRTSSEAVALAGVLEGLARERGEDGALPRRDGRAVEDAGIDPGPLEIAVRSLARATRPVILLGPVVAGNGSSVSAAIAGRLARMMRGGVIPLINEANARGAWEMGAVPDLLPGALPLADDEARRRFESAWGCTIPRDVPAASTPRALYVVGAHPPPREGAFVVVQDAFLPEHGDRTDRVKIDAVLPAAVFAEVDGSYTNLEGRVQLVCKAIEPLGDSRPDWWILCQLAKRLGVPGFEFPGPEAILAEISSLVDGYPTRDGVDRRAAKRFPSRRVEEIPLPGPPSGRVDTEFPLLLSVEEDADDYRGLPLSGLVGGLGPIGGRGVVRVHPGDARRLGLEDGCMARLASRGGGEWDARVRLSRSVGPGLVIYSGNGGQPRGPVRIQKVG